MKRSKDGLYFFLWAVPCLVLLSVLSGCILGEGYGTPEDLEAWDAHTEYDPATGRRYHTLPPPSTRDFAAGEYRSAD